MKRQNSGKEYSDREVKYLIGLLVNQTKLEQAARKLKRTPLQVKTFLLCAMGDRKRDAKGWPKADRAAKEARLIRVSSGRAQRYWTAFKRIAEQDYDRAYPGNKVPAKHKWDYFLKIFSEGSLEPVKERI